MKIGEFAKKSGVTIKTLLHYEKIGLLEADGRDDKGYRIYKDSDFLKLQQIITLKYIGLPLKEIKKIIKDNNEDLESMIKIQKQALEEKKNHIEEVIEVFNKAEKQAKVKGKLDVENLIEIIKITNMEDSIKRQYESDVNLNLRNNLHSYNIRGTDWDVWCFDNMTLKENMKILELGCGNGKLWKKNKTKINNNMTITLSDFSSSMVKSAKNNLKDMPFKFNFRNINAEEIPYEDESFDVIIAEHMIYFITDIEKALKEIKRVLKEDGVLYATTNSKNTMKELNMLCEKFAPKTNFSKNIYADRFDLENGKELLNKYFNKVELKILEGKIVVDKAEPVVSYKASTIQGEEILKGNKYNEFKEFVEEYLKDNENIKITTEAGMFICKK